MDTAKIFENGRSQAVRLPKEYRFDDSDVFIKKIDDVVMLIPKDKVWKTFRNSFSRFTDDLDLKRESNEPAQVREEPE
ncbi:MAG: type II toxin-antitoxin system VapB family antitoxin [Spirochaetales bacterium]|nr:type II toxin-antitoxin system VapB family antitoxin [Spirochaetales bacterium]